jgi:hypothetical protein
MVQVRCRCTTSPSSASAATRNAARIATQCHKSVVFPPEMVTRSARTR